MGSTVKFEPAQINRKYWTIGGANIAYKRSQSTHKKHSGTLSKMGASHPKEVQGELHFLCSCSNCLQGRVIAIMKSYDQ